MIEEPTAVGLAGFQAGGAASLPWISLGVAGMLVAAGLICTRWLIKQRASAR